MLRHAISPRARIDSQHAGDELSHIKGISSRCHLAAGRLRGAKDVGLNEVTSAATLLYRENAIQDFKSFLFRMSQSVFAEAG